MSRSTKKKLPRAYGITVETMPFERTFLDPFDYALAQFALWTPAEKETVMKIWAADHGIKAQKFVKDFQEAVTDQGSQVLLTHGRRSRHDHPRIFKLRSEGEQYNGSMSADVKSRSGWSENNGYHHTVINWRLNELKVPLGFPNCSCDCSDFRHNDIKKRKTTVPCFHVNTLEVALIEDHNSERSAAHNLTGLKPNQRYLGHGPFIAPFRFNFFKDDSSYSVREKVLHGAVISMLASHFIDGNSHYEASIEALKHMPIYSAALIEALDKGDSRASFEVIPQKEETRKMSSQEERIHASIGFTMNALERHLTDYLGYIPISHVREFVGTPHETVGRRFIPPANKRGAPVYTLCAAPLPLLVEKHLSPSLSTSWIHPSESRDDHPLGRADQPYSGVDDATRKQAAITIKLPNRGRHTNGSNPLVPVSQILADQYKIYAA